MQLSLGLCKTARFFGAFAALWLSAGAAWAGAGGADAGTLQSFLNDTLCPFLGMTTNCPNLFPNVTELVLETAALENAPPEMVRAMNAISPTATVTVGNPPAGSPFSLSNVAPLAFASPSTSKGTLSVVQPGNAAANSFFYAATNGIAAMQSPDTLVLTFDYPPLTNPQPAVSRGTDLADIMLPLTVLNGGSESAAPTLLKIRAGSCKTCYTVTATGNFTGSGPQTVNASALGLTVGVAFQSSPNAAAAHAVITVQVPLLVTAATDPAYFYDPISAVLQSLFVVDELGFTPALPGGLPIGMAPVASQFSANIANTTGVSVPAVNAYLAIATDGETLVSAPLP